MMTKRSWFWLAAALWILPVHAAPPASADLSMRPWYESLIDPKTGGSCCGEGDCRHYPTAVYADPEGKPHYQVKYGDVWLAVPDDRVLERTDNPTGDVVTCVYPDTNMEKPSPMVMCLIRAPGL